jgi:hypothetical protein
MFIMTFLIHKTLILSMKCMSIENFSLREGIVLRELREHDVLGTLILHKNVASGLDDRFQST